MASVDWLSQPGGAFFFQKAKGIRCGGRIENRRFTPIWSDGKFKKPIAQEPKYLGEMFLYVYANSLKGKPDEYMFDFLLNIGRTVGASYGLVAREEDYDAADVNVSKVVEEGKVPGMFWINYFGADFVPVFGEKNIDEVSVRSRKFIRERDFVFMMPEES